MLCGIWRYFTKYSHIQFVMDMKNVMFDVAKVIPIPNTITFD